MAFFDDDLCAGAPGVDGSPLIDAGEITCKGDSGSPLICNVDGRATMVGLVSRGVGCAFQGYPGLFTSVLENSDWLISMLGNSSFRADSTAKRAISICAESKTVSQ